MSRHNQHEPIFFTPPSGKTSGARRLYKGGGDPSAYQREQDARKEAARQAFYAGTGYNDEAQRTEREAQYGAMENDLVTYNRDKLDKEREAALRNLSFNLARSGLSGSSQDAADRAEIQRNYEQGIADIAAKAKAASATAKSGYETAFNRGLQQINAGSDANTQIASTLQEISNAMQSALEGAKGQSWSGFFGDLASTIDTAKTAQQQALVKGQVSGNPADQTLRTGTNQNGGGNSSRTF